MDTEMGLINILRLLLLVAWISGLSNGNPLLLFANHRDVQLVEVAKSHQQTLNSSIVVPNLEYAAAIDFIYDEGIIFWSDVTQEEIKRVVLNDTRHHKTVASKDLKSPVGLAVDWITHKLYWTDSQTKRIEVCNWDGNHRKVLFWQHLDLPRAIALDPQNGYMYWTDWGELPKIEKASMDGNADTRSVLIEDNIVWPNGLTIDYEDSKLYWVDAKLSFIHSCDFDGGNRRSVIEGELPHPFALTLYGDYLYWTDWVTHSIHGCDKRTGFGSFVVMDGIFSPNDIHAYMRNRQPKGQNMCGSNNGGCSHLCLLSPIDPYYTCACPTGVRLLADKKTCAEGPENTLLLARRRDIRQISLDTPDYTDLVLPLNNVVHAIALDYDSSSGFLYWTDDEVCTIQRSLLNGSEQQLVVEKDVVHPEGIAIDWIAKNLYWTDMGTNRIEVARLNGTSRKVIVSDRLDEPRAICLDPEAGYMYWSDWGQKRPAIERAFLDGSHREVIVSEDLNWPNGLAIDLVDRRIFWGDADLDKIETCNMDGSNRTTLVKGKLHHIFGFSLLGDYVYWTDWQERTIERVNKYTGENRSFIIERLPDLMGLKAVGVVQNSGMNTCGISNGNCSHLCLYRPPPYSHVCACPIGLMLLPDGCTCHKPDAFLVVSSSSDIRCISMESNSRNNEPIPIQGVHKAMSIDFDIRDNRIYWVDMELKHISRAYMNGSNLEHIIQIGLDYPEGMAVDWVAHNIYWADSGKNCIEMARLDGSSRKVLVWRNLNQPRALALDPREGYMYWIKLEKPSVLERANLDGTNRKVIISDIGQVQDLTIDYQDRRLYWTDIDNHCIKSSKMDGSDIRIVAETQVRKPMGVTQYEDFVYWTDIERQTIERANKIDGSNRSIIQSNVGPVIDILVSNDSRQEDGNACEKDNGGCSHLCMAHPRTSSTNRTRHCACPTHYTLNTDGRTCTTPKRYLLLSTRNFTIRLIFNSDMSDNTGANTEVILPIDNMRNVKALAYDPVGEFIYWVERQKRQKRMKRASDNGAKMIRRAHDNGTEASTFLNQGNTFNFQPYDIAIDPYARTLYWTCLKNNVINVTRIDVPFSPIGVIMSFQKRFKPRSIALYPEKGLMFFTNMIVNSPRIEKALMDGSAPIVIRKNMLGNPHSLTIDKRENKLYWADSSLSRIELSDLSGGNRIVLVDGQQGHPRGLAIFGEFLYWFDKKAVSRIHTKTRTDRVWVKGSKFNGLSDLIAVEHTVSATWHPCFNNNSGCSHICFISEVNTTKCSCPVDLVLKPDMKTCAEPPTCNPNQFKCADGQCIPLVWRCDGHSECEDSSDEIDCNDHQRCKDDSDENCCSGDCMHTSAVSKTDHSSKSQNESRSKTSKDYTIAIVVVIVFLLVVVILFLVCRHKTNAHNGNSNSADEDIMMVKKPLNPPLTGYSHGEEDFSPNNTLSRGKYAGSGMSMESASCLPYYDRNHVTGASSSSSGVTEYPKETLNPPPSPVTDRSLYKAASGNVYVSINSLSIFQKPGSNSGGGGGGGSGGRGGRRRRNHHHHHRRHHHHHHHHNIPPPPTTPCSTDVCEDSEPYHQHQQQRHHHRPRQHQVVSPVHTSTPAAAANASGGSNNKHCGRSSKSHSRSKKMKCRILDDSVVQLNYDSDPYPPPPTPRSHYFSDDMSCPPSPSTERSYFNPYPPPPSPVATSDC